MCAILFKIGGNMKRIVLWGLLMCFLDFNNVWAKEVNYQELYSYLENNVKEANDSNTCYDSEVSMSDSGILINYIKKANSSSLCSDKNWSFKLNFKEKSLEYSSYYFRIEADASDKIVEFLNLDNYWLEKVISFLNIDASKEYSIKGGYNIMREYYKYIDGSEYGPVYKEVPFYSCLNYLTSEDFLYAYNVDANSVTLNLNNVFHSILFSMAAVERSTDNIKFVKINAPHDYAGEYKDVGLLPNTKYYYRLKDLVIEVTTLDNKTNDNISNSGGNDINNIENPQTGEMMPWLSLIAFILGIVFIKARIKIYSK